MGRSGQSRRFRLVWQRLADMRFAVRKIGRPLRPDLMPAKSKAGCARMAERPPAGVLGQVDQRNATDRFARDDRRQCLEARIELAAVGLRANVAGINSEPWRRWLR